MPKDYANRERWKKRQGGRSTKDKRKHVSPKKKPQVKPNKARNKKPPLPWRLILLLIIVIAFVGAIISFLKHAYNGDSKNNVIVVAAKPIKPIVIKQPIIQQPVNFSFQSENASPTQAIGFILQLGTYSVGEDFLMLQNKLKNNNLPYNLIEISRFGNTYYRVQMGPYSDQTTAL